MIYIFFLCAIFCLQVIHGQYITGDNFASLADIVINETTEEVNIASIKDRDIVFVKTDYIPFWFTQCHHRIASKYILITHNSDLPVSEEYKRYLDDEKLIAWFAQNAECFVHPKLIPIPIGIANKQWHHGNTAFLDEALKYKKANNPRNKLLYVNINVNNYLQERKKVYDLFNNKRFCVVSLPNLTQQRYLYDLCESQFVCCPRGNGLDCHRTWEALLCGAIPIIRHSTSDSLYDDLPVLLIDQWEEVTENLLKNRHIEISKKTYKLEKLYMDYWEKLILSKKYNES